MSSTANNKVAHDEPTLTKGLTSPGAERLKADCRMFGGLLLTLGLCASYGSFADIATLADNATQGLPLALLIASVLQAFFGTICMAVGFMTVVMDSGSANLTAIAAISIQLAWVPFLTNLSGLGMGIVSDPESNPFIPYDEYNPNSADVKFVGSMSFIALVAYAFGYIGSLGFMAFSLHAIQSGKPHLRSGLYYRGRAKGYNGLLMLAGLTQLAIGSFIIHRIGNGPLSQPVSAAVYPVIYFPEISVMCGGLQIIVGVIGVARSRNTSKGQGAWFQALCFFMYVCMISLQLLVQIAYAPMGTAAAAAPTLGFTQLGLAMMPAFLDWKMNNVPDDLSGYYGEDEKESLVLELENESSNIDNV